MTHKALASSIVMVRPKHFGFNEQTAADNVFQKHNHLSSQEVLDLANQEFDAMVENIESKNIQVLVFDPEYPKGVVTPDAIFPNNWFVTTPEGDVYVFPMSTENRRQEREVEQLSLLLSQHGYDIRQLSWVGSPIEAENILEGTGVMILDHTDKSIYAGLSQRCHLKQLKNFIAISGYKPESIFSTHGMTDQPIYHTNVLMSIGDDYAVVCFDSIEDTDRQQLTNQLNASRKKIISITMEQMYAMCGNILQLKTRSGEPAIVMSELAYNHFTPVQRSVLEKCGDLIVCPIPTIESIGGGSCRCMIAENFLPRRI